MLDYLWARYKIRMALMCVAVPIVLFCMGVGETWRSLRMTIGPSTISYTEASESGLRGYGYVRITDLRPDVPNAMVIMRENTHEWTRAYVPILPPEGEQQGKYRVLAYLPEARQSEDLLEVGESDELIGYVKGTYDRVNPGFKSRMMWLGGPISANCWVVEVRKTSWLRGLGFTLGSAVIPAAWMVFRKPLYED